MVCIAMEKSLVLSSAITTRVCKSLSAMEASEPTLGVAICQFSKKQIGVQCVLFFIFLGEEGRIYGFGAVTFGFEFHLINAFLDA